MLEELSREERMRLLRFICALAWADLEVQSEERVFITELVSRLQLDPSEIAQVEAWLEVPPPAEEVDPTEIPPAHRRLFLDTIRQLVDADGALASEEHASLALIEDLLAQS
ncbi:MAG: TerB family tellurite resistance protein [Myxococcota bacterium]